MHSAQNPLPQALFSGAHQQQMIMPLAGSAPTSSNAQLWIFSPKNMPQQVRRAHLYNFSPQFITEVGDRVTQAMHTGTNLMTASLMPGSQLAPSAIMPCSHGTPVNLNVFSELWSFMLLIDMIRGSRMSMGMLAPGQHIPFDMRFIYVGYCSEEPVNPMNHGNLTPTLNPMSTLIVTHHTAVNQEHQIDANGSVARINTMSDLDLIPRHIVPQVSTADATGRIQPNYLLTPDNLIRSTNIQASGQATVFDGLESQITPSTNNTPVIAALNSPRHHTCDIVRGVASAVMHTNASQMTGGGPMDDYITPGGPLLMEPNLDAFHAVVQANYSMNSSNAAIPYCPIDHTKPFTLGELNRLFPSIKVVDCRQPQQSAWDTIPQNAPNVTNIFSSMLSTTIPVLLANQGLAQIAFRYRSRSLTSAIVSSVPAPDCELYDIAAFIQMPPNMLSAKFKLFIDHLQTTVFPTLLLAAGEFDLTMYSSVAGTSLINLMFLDTPSLSHHGAYYEAANALGGLMSPMIGCTNEHHHNTMQLANLIGSLAPSNDYGNPVFNPGIMMPNGVSADHTQVPYMGNPTGAIGAPMNGQVPQPSPSGMHTDTPYDPTQPLY